MQLEKKEEKVQTSAYSNHGGERCTSRPIYIYMDFMTRLKESEDENTAQR
jgi:hypothetical protein